MGGKEPAANWKSVLPVAFKVMISGIYHSQFRDDVEHALGSSCANASGSCQQLIPMLDGAVL